MLVRQAIETRVSSVPGTDEDAGRRRLPRTLKPDRLSVRTALYRRLAASRLFALGDRAGGLKAAQRRSGQVFRLDVRQRVIVKALVCRHAGGASVRGAALARHVAYLGRGGAGADGARATFFDLVSDGVNAADATREWSMDRHHFRFIVSPEHGDRIADLKGYVRDVMGRVSADLGEPLSWIGACHFDTDQPHAHVLVRGRRANGRDLVVPRNYIAFGVRARAQEAAQERLGDLSRADAERRIWRETEADRFTGFDRRLLLAADRDGWVEDGVGRNDAWSALTRGRLRHLERLGLAQPLGRRYRLAADLEVRLRTLQMRRDVIRTLNQRRLEGARQVRQLGAQAVQGRVVRAGSHDELGRAPYVIVRDREGIEHYARLAIGRGSARPGSLIELRPGAHGAEIRGVGRPPLSQGL